MARSEAMSQGLRPLWFIAIRRRWDIDTTAGSSLRTDPCSSVASPKTHTCDSPTRTTCTRSRTCGSAVGSPRAATATTVTCSFPTSLDRIIIPALRASCGKNILQHHPRSFTKATCKASVKKELHLHGGKCAMDIQYTVPEVELDRFWHSVLRHCRKHNNQGFQKPFLIISGHNLKLHSKHLSASKAQVNFLQHLNQCFCIDDQHLSPNNCWLALSIKNTLKADPGIGVTLLWKVECCSHWTTLFACPTRRTPNTQPRTFF